MLVSGGPLDRVLARAVFVVKPDGKISQLDARAGACVDEYVRLINTGAGQRNHKFELRLQPHLRLRLRNLAQP